MPSVRASNISALRQLTVSSAQQQFRRNLDTCTGGTIVRRCVSSQAGYGKSRRPMRFFHTTPSAKALHDASPIDFVYMPQFELEEPTQPEIMRIPLLPNNYSPLRLSEAHQEAVEPVIRPEISTVSADGTHIDSPSAMSEVTDNHAVELDPFDLTHKVTAAAANMAGMRLKEPGVMTELWNGLLDDLLGSKKFSKA